MLHVPGAGRGHRHGPRCSGRPTPTERSPVHEALQCPECQGPVPFTSGHLRERLSSVRHTWELVSVTTHAEQGAPHAHRVFHKGTSLALPCLFPQ